MQKELRKTSSLGDSNISLASLLVDKLICNNTHCTSDEDEDEGSLVCTKCRRLVHYRCTKLPAYQIQVINTKRNYAYYCQNCVTVPQELLEVVSQPDRLLANSKKEIDRLRREIKACEALIKQCEENEKKLKETI